MMNLLRKCTTYLALVLSIWACLAQTTNVVMADPATPATPAPVKPLPTSEKEALNVNPLYISDGGGGSCSASSGDASSSVSSSSSPLAEFTIDQVTTFASEPVTSTWNIPDGTAEQWFLKQGGAQATIAKYGLSSSNIGSITAAIKAGGASPAFFYLYTVNEGGGAGGFINHFGDEATGGGPGNATRDAQYLVSQSGAKGSPATGGGEPGDLPTAEAQQILNAVPSGSIGAVYIQATSAVTAELEYLSGKSGDWNPGDSASPATQFGSPLEETMRNIKTLGGNPQQGGTTIATAGSSCTAGTVAGEGMTKAINFAVSIANNDGYSYSQPARETGWAKYQSDQSCTSACGSFDCSSLIAAALTEAGYFQTNPEFVTGTEGAALTGVGFTDITSSVNLTTDQGMQPGDILVNTADHTAMYIGNGMVVQAADPADGINVIGYYDFPWDHVYRAPSDPNS